MVYIVLFAADKDKQQKDQDKKSQLGEQVVPASPTSVEKTQSKRKDSESDNKSEGGSDKASSAVAAGKDGGSNERHETVSGSTHAVPPSVCWV